MGNSPANNKFSKPDSRTQPRRQYAEVLVGNRREQCIPAHQGQGWRQPGSVMQGHWQAPLTSDSGLWRQQNPQAFRQGSIANQPRFGNSSESNGLVQGRCDKTGNQQENAKGTQQRAPWQQQPRGPPARNDRLGFQEWKTRGRDEQRQSTVSFKQATVNHMKGAVEKLHARVDHPYYKKLRKIRDHFWLSRQTGEWQLQQR